MNRKMKYSLIAVLFLAVLFTVWRIAGTTPSSDPRRQNAALVQIEPVAHETVKYTLILNGDALPIQQATIYSKVPGTLEHIYVDMGDRVEVNQMMALIDTTELAQTFQQTTATYQNATLTYRRMKELSEQNLVSRQDLDNAEAAMKVAQANYDGARTRLGYARITAPFSGYITRRFLDAGGSVTANNVTLFTLMDLDAMKVILNVLEKDVPKIKIGKEAVITVDAYPDKQFQGTIARFSNALDLSTRTMAIEVDILNKDHLLKPGMFATVVIFVEEHPNAMTVPTQALLHDERGSFLFIAQGNTAKRRDVTIGIEQNARTEILSGVADSDSIVTTGQQFLRQGTPVTIVK